MPTVYMSLRHHSDKGCSHIKYWRMYILWFWLIVHWGICNNLQPYGMPRWQYFYYNWCINQYPRMCTMLTRYILNRRNCYCLPWDGLLEWKNFRQVCRHTSHRWLQCLCNRQLFLRRWHHMHPFSLSKWVPCHQIRSFARDRRLWNLFNRHIIPGWKFNWMQTDWLSSREISDISRCSNQYGRLRGVYVWLLINRWSVNWMLRHELCSWDQGNNLRRYKHHPRLFRVPKGHLVRRRQFNQMHPDEVRQRHDCNPGVRHYRNWGLHLMCSGFLVHWG